MIECIPNFSEGRRPEVIAAIVDAIAAVPGVLLLDTHTDADHNRSVVTFAAPAAVVGEAAFQGIKVAAQRIDLREHSGEHPRIGAADVVPFVPLRGATLDECVAVARALGARLAAELGLPVYMYGAAAYRPERRELPDIRRGGYEVLREAIGHDPARTPDFGPCLLGAAGASVVGARPPLIAYNLFLNTGDVQVARQIARAVRGSSGGLRHVRALGMLVDGRAQVSMNLTDYRATPVHRAVDMVVRQAAMHGAAVVAGELVGLIPEDALLDTGRSYMRLHHMSEAQVLERRVAEVAGTGDWWKQPAPSALPATPAASFAAQADVVWQQTVLALAAAAHEYAAEQRNHWLRSMLRTLGNTLSPLLHGAAAPDAAAAARAVQLIGRLAVKLAEAVLADVLASQADPSQATVLLAHLAYHAVTGARLRAATLLPHLPAAERVALTDELADHDARARALITSFETLYYAAAERAPGG